MKLLFSIIALFVIMMNNLVAQNEEDSNLYQIEEDEIVYADKDPAMAFLYSLALPGLGQLYNEQLDKGFILMGGSLLGGILFLSSDEDNDKLTLLGAATFVFCSIYSFIDAPIQSSKINQRNRINRINILKKYGHLMSYDLKNSTIGLDIDYNKVRGFNIGMTYHF